MANTTNFGWETPDDTDLVKDGAAAIRTLGSAIDTSLVDLKGGTTGQVLAKNSNTDMDFIWTAGGDITEVTAGTGISGGGTSGAVTITNSMATAIDAKGDLVVGTGADTFSRLGVGANGTVLTADSAETTGLKWATPASGGMTLLTSGTISSSPLNLTSISQDYKQLVLFLWDFTSASANSTLIRLNNDSGSNYFAAGVNTRVTTQVGGANAATSIDINANDYNGATGDNHAVITIPNYTAAAYKVFRINSIVTLNGGTTWGVVDYGCGYKSTTAISQINILNQTSGSYELYGVK